MLFSLKDKLKRQAAEAEEEKKASEAAKLAAIKTPKRGRKVGGLRADKKK